MKTYIAIAQSVNSSHEPLPEHFDADSAERTVARISHTDKDGSKIEGAHWSPQQIEQLTSHMVFPEGTTIWDKYVAFNYFYADLYSVIGNDATLLLAAHAFYFADEDAPDNKLYRYFRAME